MSYSNFQDLNNGASVVAGSILDVDNSIFTSMGATAINTAAGTAVPTNVTNNSFYNAAVVFGGAGTYLSDGHNKIGSGSAQGATPSAMNVQ